MINLRSITLLCSIGIILIMVVSVLGLVNLTTNSNVNTDQNNIRLALQNENPSSGSIKILNQQMTKTSYGDWIVKGQAQNVGSGQLRYTSINVNFYKNENIIYTSSAILSSMAPGEIKNFQVVYPDQNNSPDSYDVSLGSSW